MSSGNTFSVTAKNINMRNINTHFHSVEDVLVISLTLTFIHRKKVFKEIKTSKAFTKMQHKLIFIFLVVTFSFLLRKVPLTLLVKLVYWCETLFVSLVCKTLICSFESSNLQLIPSNVFFISVTVFFSCVWFFFIFSIITLYETSHCVHPFFSQVC